MSSLDEESESFGDVTDVRREQHPLKVGTSILELVNKFQCRLSKLKGLNVRPEFTRFCIQFFQAIFPHFISFSNCGSKCSLLQLLQRLFRFTVRFGICKGRIVCIFDIVRKIIFDKSIQLGKFLTVRRRI